MVKPTKVGKARSFWRGFFLTIVTLGIYSIYWEFKTHHEVYQQFDLEDEGRDEGIILFILAILIPLVGLILFFIYMAKFIGNVNFVRGKMGQGEGVGALEFILWTTAGWLILVGPVIGYYKLQTTINGVWASYDKRAAEMRAPPVPVPPAAPAMH